MASYYSAGSSHPSGGDTMGGNGYYNYGQKKQDQEHQQQQQQQQQQPFHSSGQQQAPHFSSSHPWQASSTSFSGVASNSISGAAPMPNSQPSFWNPATAATVAAMATSVATSGMNNPDAMLEFASSAGTTFLASSSARMIPGLEAIMTNLRGYFAVDNRYVQGKMGRILFPFLAQSWKRMPSEPVGPEVKIAYALPNADGNAPDLYIPLMSFITYVLLCAMVYGNAGKFSPQVISQVATLCFGCQVVEVLGMRFGIYMLQSPIPVLDLLSYTGYKYLGLCVNMIAGITLSHFGMGKEAYYIFFVYTSLAACWFMLKTLANNIPISSSSGRNRDMMVLAFAVSQAIVMYLVGKTKFLT